MFSWGVFLLSKQRGCFAGNVTPVNIIRWVEYQLIAFEYLSMEDRRFFVDIIKEGDLRHCHETERFLFGFLVKVAVWKEKLRKQLLILSLFFKLKTSVLLLNCHFQTHTYVYQSFFGTVYH